MPALAWDHLRNTSTRSGESSFVVRFRLILSVICTTVQSKAFSKARLPQNSRQNANRLLSWDKSDCSLPRTKLSFGSLISGSGIRSLCQSIPFLLDVSSVSIPLRNIIVLKLQDL